MTHTYVDLGIAMTDFLKDLTKRLGLTGNGGTVKEQTKQARREIRRCTTRVDGKIRISEGEIHRDIRELNVLKQRIVDAKNAGKTSMEIQMLLDQVNHKMFSALNTKKKYAMLGKVKRQLAAFEMNLESQISTHGVNGLLSSLNQISDLIAGKDLQVQIEENFEEFEDNAEKMQETQALADETITRMANTSGGVSDSLVNQGCHDLLREIGLDQVLSANEQAAVMHSSALPIPAPTTAPVANDQPSRSAVSAEPPSTQASGGASGRGGGGVVGGIDLAVARERMERLKQKRKK